MPILDDFKSRFPEFESNGVDVDGLLPPLIVVYSCYNGWDYNAKCGREIILNLLAHLLVGASNSAPNPIEILGGVSVGDVSITNVVASVKGQSADFFNATKYGRTYLQLISYNRGGVFV